MTFTASEVKCLELNMDLDKIAASGQCFRWTPAPFPGGYIVPAGGYCATIYRLDGKIVVHEHTISHHNTLNPAAQNRPGILGELPRRRRIFHTVGRSRVLPRPGAGVVHSPRGLGGLRYANSPATAL